MSSDFWIKERKLLTVEVQEGVCIDLEYNLNVLYYIEFVLSILDYRI